MNSINIFRFNIKTLILILVLSTIFFACNQQNKSNIDTTATVKDGLPNPKDISACTYVDDKLVDPFLNADSVNFVYLSNNYKKFLSKKTVKNKDNDSLTDTVITFTIRQTEFNFMKGIDGVYLTDATIYDNILPLKKQIKVGMSKNDLMGYMHVNSMNCDSILIQDSEQISTITLVFKEGILKTIVLPYIDED